jgi:DNA-directed RNA polymerase specialized sigma24 family protein
MDRDAELFGDALSDDFGGGAGEALADRLIAYGYQVVGAWVRAGVIVEVCRSRQVRGLSRGSSVAGWTRQDVEDLVQETVWRAWARFVDTARQGTGWCPDGGASLRTYFVNACLFAFPGAYRRQTQQLRRSAREAAVGVLPGTCQEDVADAVVGWHALLDHLRGIDDPRLRLMLLLDAEGYGTAEIALMMPEPTTPRAVEGVLYRFRRHLRSGEQDQGGREQ